MGGEFLLIPKTLKNKTAGNLTSGVWPYQVYVIKDDETKNAFVLVSPSGRSRDISNTSILTCSVLSYTKNLTARREDLCVYWDSTGLCK